MIDEQLVPTFIAQLLIEGVSPEQIEGAVGRVLDVRPGQSISGNDPMRRAFAYEQARLLEQARTSGLRADADRTVAT